MRSPLANWRSLRSALIETSLPSSPASRIRTVYGATDIQVLPGSAVASILGESADAKADIDEYRRAGVADEELKLGLVPMNGP